MVGHVTDPLNVAKNGVEFDLMSTQSSVPRIEGLPFKVLAGKIFPGQLSQSVLVSLFFES